MASLVLCDEGARILVELLLVAVPQLLPLPGEHLTEEVLAVDGPRHRRLPLKAAHTQWLLLRHHFALAAALLAHDAAHLLKSPDKLGRLHHAVWVGQPTFFEN